MAAVRASCLEALQSFNHLLISQIYVESKRTLQSGLQPRTTSDDRISCSAVAYTVFHLLRKEVTIVVLKKISLVNEPRQINETRYMLVVSSLSK